MLSAACSTEVKFWSYKIKNNQPCSAQRLDLLCRSKSKSRETFSKWMSHSFATVVLPWSMFNDVCYFSIPKHASFTPLSNVERIRVSSFQMEQVISDRSINMTVLNCTHNVPQFPDYLKKKQTAHSTRGLKFRSKQVEIRELKRGPSIKHEPSVKFPSFAGDTRSFFIHLFALIENYVFVLGSPFNYERFFPLKCKF